MSGEELGDQTGGVIRAARWCVLGAGCNQYTRDLFGEARTPMRRLTLLLAALALLGSLLGPRPANAWVVGAGLGFGYGGGLPCAGAAYYGGPAYFPAPIYVAPTYYPPVYWPGYEADIAVRLNRYFDPRDSQIRGYTLPR
jgi:hypothetical protein